MQLSIIIVSFNTKKLLQDCLSSIYKHTKNPELTYEIIIVDNASSDGSPEMVKAKYPNVKLICNRNNAGFAAANNQAIKQVKGELVFLLNSDTVIHSGALDNLIEFMHTHPHVGICSPQLLNPDGSIQPQGGALPTLFHIALWILFIDDLPFISAHIPTYQQQSKSFFHKTRETGWVAGTAMLIRHSIFKQMGQLDQKIFMYSEDTDFCLRAWLHQWQMWNLATAQVTHLGQGSGSSVNAIHGEYKGLIYLYKKHFPHWQLPLLRLLLKMGALLRMLLFGKIIRNTQKYETYKTAYRLV